MFEWFEDSVADLFGEVDEAVDREFYAVRGEESRGHYEEDAGVGTRRYVYFFTEDY